MHQKPSEMAAPIFCPDEGGGGQSREYKTSAALMEALAARDALQFWSDGAIPEARFSDADFGSTKTAVPRKSDERTNEGRK